MSDKRCGTCRWWDPLPKASEWHETAPGDCGWTRANLPEPLYRVTEEDDGTDCAKWEKPDVQ